MDAEIKQQWLTALESGEYKKTTGRLKDDSGYCCLGVLCDLHSKATGMPWDNEARTGQDTNKFTVYSYYSTTSILPDEVRTWAKLETRYGYVNTDVSLAEVNDQTDTFAEVIELIKENF